jgi:hypothetical protein
VFAVSTHTNKPTDLYLVNITRGVPLMCQKCNEFFERRANEYMDLIEEIQKHVLNQMKEGGDQQNAALLNATEATNYLQSLQIDIQERVLTLTQAMPGSAEAKRIAKRMAKLTVKMTTEIIEGVVDVLEVVDENSEPFKLHTPFDPRRN